MLRRDRCKAGEQRCNVCDKGANAVDDGPCDPDAFQPVPCLVNLVLIVGELSSHHCDCGHKSGKHGADAGDFVVDVNDDRFRHRPHILDGGSGQNRHRENKEHDKGEGIDTIELFQREVLLKMAKIKGTTLPAEPSPRRYEVGFAGVRWASQSLPLGFALAPGLGLILAGDNTGDKGNGSYGGKNRNVLFMISPPLIMGMTIGISPPLKQKI